VQEIYLYAKNFQVDLLSRISLRILPMSQNKLHIYIASTLLANILIAAGLLPPAHAKSGETIKSRNSVEKLALNTSSQTDADATLLQGNGAKIDSTQFNQGEVTSCPLTSNAQGLTTTTTTDIVQRALIQYLNSRLIGNEIKVLNSSKLDLDSILANEFDQKGIQLLSRCCF
jgi:hypothetical protein